ncbi:Cytochrome p450, partial [Thalictrum thalictroides]
MKVVSDKFDVFNNYVIADHMAKKHFPGNNFVLKEMVDVLLQLSDDDIDPEDLMLGGTDTSGITIEWTTHEIVRHPRALARLREELDTPDFALEDCNAAGYDIAKDTIIFLNSWSIGRHPDYWDDPYEFKPERYLRGREISMTGQYFTLWPFGSGRRGCPAYTLALRLVRTTVANMFHGFNWIFPEGMKARNICMVE